MPKMDGFEATRRIMETQPTPIVVVSGSTSVKDVSNALRTVEAGALSIIPRPYGLGHPQHAASAKELVQMIKLMAGVKVVKHWPKRQIKTEPLPLPVVISVKTTTRDTGSCNGWLYRCHHRISDHIARATRGFSGTGINCPTHGDRFY
jgi:chemotaxis response regulator CheB